MATEVTESRLTGSMPLPGATALARRHGGSAHDCPALVQRGAMWRIVTAWVITVPATALLAAALFSVPQGLR